MLRPVYESPLRDTLATFARRINRGCGETVRAASIWLGLRAALFLASIAPGVASAAQAASATSPPPVIDPVVPAAPVNTALPIVFGVAIDGQTLSSTPGTWVSAPTLTYIYQWRRCDSAGGNCLGIDGATRAAYTLAAADVGASLRLAVTAANASGELTANSAASATVAAAPSLNTAPPNISGIATDGQTLSSTLGTWTGTPPITYSRQWRRCDRAGGDCLEIEGATGATYNLSREDVGSTVRVVVTAADAAQSAVSATSAETASVGAAVPPAAFTAAGGAHATWVGWGSNMGGILGAGYASFNPALVPVPVLIATPKELVPFSATLALMPDGTVESWGENPQGQLGDGTRNRRMNPGVIPNLRNVTQVAAKGEHAIALLSNGTVVTWGNNLHGQLGNGSYALPHTEACTANCRSLVPVPVPGLAGVTAVFAGGADCFALLNTGVVLGWGENLNGVLGTGDRMERDVPTVVPRLTNVRTLAVGGAASLGGHMLALLNDGTVEATGFNGQGQLGIGSTVSSLFAVKVPTLSRVTAISASWTHSLAVANGKLLAWGNNETGELGSKTATLCGAKPCARSPIPVPLEGVTSIAAGYGASFAASGGHAWSWGDNPTGQLGTGDRVDRGSPALVRGADGVLSVTTHFAQVSGPAPPPAIEATSGARSLSVKWRATGGTGWNITWRASTGVYHREPPFGPLVKLPASARSYTATGLAGGTRYEVVVEQVGGIFGRDVVEGVPLP